MDDVWQHAPAVALLVHRGADGLRATPNAAARAWAAARTLDAAWWRRLAALAADGPLALDGHGFDCRCVPLADDARLVWLTPHGDVVPAALDAARRTAAFLDRALGLAGVAVWRVDLAHARVHFNAVGFHVAGMTQDPAGVPLAALRATVHPDDLDAVERAAAEALAGDRIVDLVARWRNADGSWRTLLTRRVADRDGDGRAVGLAGVSLDLTQQLADRERAEALAARSALVAEALGVGFWSRDIDAGQAHWDDQMYRIHRRPPDAGVPGFDSWIDEYVHPQDRAWAADLHRRASGDWQPVVDTVFRTLDAADGSARWVRSWTRRVVRDGRRLAFGMHLDVTDQQNAQTRAERERARTQMAIEAAQIGIWERARDGTPVHWNAAMYRLRKLQPDDPRSLVELGRLCSMPEDNATVDGLVRHCMDSGAPYRHEFRIRCADGSERWIVTQGSALRDDAGRVVGMAGINLDITERREAEQLRQDMLRAQQAARDKAAFFARVSHELRTPMNAVLGFAQLLADGSEPLTAGQRLRVTRILEAGAGMMALVDDLLELANRAKASTAPAAAAPVALAALVRHAALAHTAPALDAGVALRVVRCDDAATECAAEARIRQALAQIVGHAVRHEPRGGTVEIVGRRIGDRIAVAVRGTAPPAGDAATLFEPFAPQADGVGLAVARHVAEACGGSIDIVAGAIELSLPAAGTARLKLLCVEDNPVNLLLVREMLALRPGVAVREATDGRSAIAMALAEPPDVVLLDLQLPDIAGLDVLRRLRGEPAMRRCVWVALSADAMPDHIAAARAAGFDDYWTKPIDCERFLADIDRLTARTASRLGEPLTS